MFDTRLYDLAKIDKLIRKIKQLIFPTDLGRSTLNIQEEQQLKQCLEMAIYHHYLSDSNEFRKTIDCHSEATLLVELLNNGTITLDRYELFTTIIVLENIVKNTTELLAIVQQAQPQYEAVGSALATKFKTLSDASYMSLYGRYGYHDIVELIIKPEKKDQVLPHIQELFKSCDHKVVTGNQVVCYQDIGGDLPPVYVIVKIIYGSIYTNVD